MRRRWLGRPVGSSPHTRGTRYCTNNECETFRFIPAYAGNDPSVPRELWPPPVHPRIRGERFLRPLLRQRDHGSSPHTRGTRPSGGPPPGRKRFIPAYAGNAPEGRPHCPASSVHPRIRGERGFGKDAVFYAYGSSPHTRGTQQRDCPCRALDRFIPAYAGNARRTPSLRRRATVHPRIRGERGPLGCRIAPTSGSSPHTRGTLEVQLGNKHRPRFIPAYAGNAAVHLLLLDLMSVHPRIRGERCHPGRARHVGHGSSPHTRGTQAQDRHF